MKVTIKTVSKEEHALEISETATVGELKKLACDNFAGAGANLTLVHLGAVLSDDSKGLGAHGIADGAVMVAIVKKAKTDAAPAAAPAAAPVPVPAAMDTSGSSKTIRVTVSDIEGDVRTIEVEENETVENVKAVLEVEFAIPLAQQQLFFEAKQLQNDQRLDAIGIKNDDMMQMQATRAAPMRPPAQLGAGPAGLNLMGLFGGGMGGAASARSNPLQQHLPQANELIQQASSNPHFTRRMREGGSTDMADAIDAGNPEEVAKALLEWEKTKKETEFKKNQAIMKLNDDPFDVEAQKQIEEMVRMENVNANHEQAIEYNPEAFASVIMLYVDCEVNGVEVKAFVDSGAQITIMSQICAQRLGLMRLIDRRYQGMAKGVGTSKILGRVHAAQMKMGGMHITISINVLEDDSMEFLFGLDNLRRHQMCIDLKDNMLKCDNMKVPFLSEGDLPKRLMGAGGDGDAMDVEQVGASAGGGASSAGGQEGGAATGGADNPPAAAIDMLTGMGFSRDQAVAALKSCGGNPELAASLLFGGD